MTYSNEKKSQPTENVFPPDLGVDVNSKEILKKAEFIHDNSKEYLLKISESRETLQKKTLLILSFIFAFISFSIFHVINLAEKNSYLWICFFTITILFYLITAIFLVLKCFYPKEDAISGNEPKNLLTQGNIDQQYALMLITETMTYQERIDKNDISNKKTVLWLKCSIWSIILTPVLSFLLIKIPATQGICIWLTNYLL